PLVEYIDSVISVNGRSLSLRTSKLVEQLYGITLGVRANITPQGARIYAPVLNREGQTRLCDSVTVLHARQSELLSDGELLQIGAEIFGHKGVEADIEIIEMALESVGKAGVKRARLDLNHPGVFRAIINGYPELVNYADEISDLLSFK